MSEILSDTFERVCRSVDSPKSLGVWLRFKHAQDELANVSIDPLAYNDAASFYADYVCVSLLRKFEGLDTHIDTRKVALQAFDKAEEQCRITNENLRTYRLTGRVDQVEHSILLNAQQLIADVWGSPSFDAMFRHCGWGPGSTATLKGASATTEDKMSRLPLSVTPSALPYLRQVMKNDLLWCGHLLKCQVDGPVCLMPSYYGQTDCSRLLTVPKDAKTDRVIAAEPTGNIFLQMGIGRYLRSRLRKYGVNLEDQTRNQMLAASAVQLGLSTLDLSAASDSISIELCRVLLPDDMFKVLNDIRSPSFSLGQEVTRFHKFSSMGNGFTFQLESLIFWAVAKAVARVRKCRAPIGVYGDDIIVHQSITQEVITTLESFGFNINKSKSFVDGRFFESCGKHYFDAIDVTPVYQKHIIDNDLELSRFANRIFESAYCRPYLGAKKRFGKIHSRLISKLPERLKKFYCPSGLILDGTFRVLHFNGEFNANRGYHVSSMMATKGAKRLADGGLYAYHMRKHAEPFDKLFGILSDKPSYGYVDIRPKDRITTYKRTKHWVPIWKLVT